MGRYNSVYSGSQVDALLASIGTAGGGGLWTASADNIITRDSDTQITGSLEITGDITGSLGLNLRDRIQTRYEDTTLSTGSLKIFMGDTGSQGYQNWKSGSGDSTDAI